MRIAIIGANGQLAQDLAPALQAAGHDVVGLCHHEIEVSDAASVDKALRAITPEAVINTAAYHKVDEVEENPDHAFAVNATGAANVARVCRQLDAITVFLSTDYVFSGTKGSPYIEFDAVDPVNVYGVSKAAGEMLVRYLCPRHFIVRVSGLYGKAGSSGKGGNFIETMLRLAREGKAIKVVSDQTLTPTPTVAVAQQIVRLLESDAFGTYHATCQGECSWYDFAAEIFKAAELSPSLSPQTTQESGARAKRPTYSVLENAALKRLGIDIMPDWRDGVSSYVLKQR
jgi:dTDP-4-dehydrorhamnose reductase